MSAFKQPQTAVVTGTCRTQWARAAVEARLSSHFREATVAVSVAESWGCVPCAASLGCGCFNSGLKAAHHGNFATGDIGHKSCGKAESKISARSARIGQICIQLCNGSAIVGSGLTNLPVHLPHVGVQ
ncbi:unnamed protein product [Polarella glacialis]|uniref:Uncharacterized protein n=1 Tax=Polarella glacialis TaxID=89957 RepID=A0A813H830_POLGL|nr:unnamed protein product [Polarella glacialis]